MFLSNETLSALIALGAPAEKLAEVIRMIEKDAESVQPRRSTGAERQARYRERHAASQSVTPRHETSPGVTAPLPLAPSPQTPQPHTPTPGEISTRARKGGPTKVEIARGFAAFWAAYPKRVGKDAAAKSFAKAMARIADADPLAVILAGIERALPGWDDPQFIPHPATWLNQGRWADEEPPPPKVTPLRSNHDRPDPLTAKRDNLDRGFRAAESGADLLAARRAM